MNVTVIGTGFIGGTLGRALAGRGHEVTFGSRHPESDNVAGDSAAAVTSIGESLAAPDVIILALPGSAVAGLAADHGSALSGRLVIDATNQLGAAVANARAELPAGVDALFRLWIALAVTQGRGRRLAFRLLEG